MKTRQHDIMIDIETLGTDVDAIPVTIGVAQFVLGEEDPVLDKFQIAIHVGTAEKAGLSMSANTIMWWMQQSPEAQRSLIDDKAISLKQGLLQLTEYIAGVRTKNHRNRINIWANDPDFDLVRLNHAYRAINESEPWQYWESRSCRTMVELGERLFGFNKKEDFPREGTHHNAADDAEYQAQLVNYIYRKLQR